VTVASFLPIGKGASPAAVAGGLNLDPIELMRSETNNMFVPAQAEVVIEGEVSVSETHLEGPFPEYWYYKAAEKKPVFTITAITHRSDPIIPISVDGVKPSDKHILESIMVSFELYRRYIKEKNMFVKWVQLPIEFNFGFIVVSAPILFPGYVSWLSKYAMANSRKLGSFWNKVIVLDDKTSSASLEETIVCFIQRSHANRAYHMWDGLPTGPNARWATEHQRKGGEASSGLYVDTSWPPDWTPDDVPRRCNLEGSYPEEMIKKVVENYNKYGFKGKPVFYPEGVIPF
jgi:4-hydroxy-3-polyprenylbenzoate decarboxylase